MWLFLSKYDINVRWYKKKNGNRQLITTGGRFEQKSGSLFIHEVQIEDEATYICEVNNTLNVENAETTLSVTGSSYERVSSLRF